MRTWIKDPLAIFADGAERGIVVEGTRIAELVVRGRDAGAHRLRRSTPPATSCCRASSTRIIISIRP